MSKKAAKDSQKKLQITNLEDGSEQDESSLGSQVIENICADKDKEKRDPKKTILNLQDIIPIISNTSVAKDKRELVIDELSDCLQSDEQPSEVDHMVKEFYEPPFYDDSGDSLRTLTKGQILQIIQLERNFQCDLDRFTRLDKELSVGIGVKPLVIQKTCEELKKRLQSGELERIPPDVLYWRTFGHSLNKMLDILKKIENQILDPQKELTALVTETLVMMDRRILENVAAVYPVFRLPRTQREVRHQAETRKEKS